MDTRRLPGRADRRHAGRLVRGRDARSRDRRRSVVLGRRSLAVLSLRPYRCDERVRLRGSHGTPEAGHQRRQRRVPAGAVARRQVAGVRGLHACRLRRLRDEARRVSVARSAPLRGDAPGSARRTGARRAHAQDLQPADHVRPARVRRVDHARQLRRGFHRFRRGRRRRGHSRLRGEHHDRVGAPRPADEHPVHVRAPALRREPGRLPADHARDEQLLARLQHGGVDPGDGGRDGGHQLLDAPGVRLAVVQPELQHRARRGAAPPPGQRAQSVRHPLRPVAGDARHGAPRLGVLERGGIPLERRQREGDSP